jgi:HEAT repeat protein
MTYLPGLTEKIAISLTLDLLKSAGVGVRRRLSKGETEKALQASVAAALSAALAAQNLVTIDHDHFSSLFEGFFRREAVIEELSQLLDPRPGVEIDFAVLEKELEEAGWDQELISQFRLDDFLRTFASAFYAAAASHEVLRGSLEMKLLGEMVSRTGAVVGNTQRTAEATEKMVGLLQRVLENQAPTSALLQAGQEAREHGFLAAFQAYDGLRTALLKAGFDLGVDQTGRIEILGSDRKALPSSQEETIRNLAIELRETVRERAPEPAELDALEERYRQHIIRWFENLQFQGLMRTPRPILLPLEEVYVELRAVAEVPEAADAFSVEERRLLLDIEEKDDTGRRELMKQLDSLRRERWSRTLPERKSMAEALHQRDRRAFVILGDPGSGKTTLLHVLALVYARGPEAAARRLKVDPTEADRLPIFAPLAAFDDMLRETPGLTLLEFLPRYYDRRRGLPGLGPLFRRALDSGRALVLLDGLDEVLDTSTRSYIAQQAGALISDLTPRGVRFAVSSRFVGYREAPVPGNLPSLSVLDFGEPEIDLFVRRWAYAYEKWAAENQETPEMLARARTLESDLLVDVKSNESVRRLAANPLMLTMLALLRRQVGELPHRRVQLYESYVGALLETWIDVRTPGAHEKDAKTFDRFRAENLLLPLALWLQKEKPSGTAGGFEIREKLTDICLKEAGLTREQADVPKLREAEKQGNEFLREMRQLTGLLIERGHDAYGFLHLTFQEYFVGRALASLNDDERWKMVKPHLHDPRWREPILLCAGRLGVVENRRPQVTAFVRSILNCDDPTEEKLHRNLLLALAIAGDDVNLDPALIQEMVGRAVGCMPNWIETLMKGLVSGLGQLVANGAAGVGECFEKVLGSEHWWQRKVVVEALSRFAAVEGIRGLLLERLRDANPEVVEVSLEALSSQVAAVKKVRRKVMKRLKDRDGQVRQAAVRALTEVVESDPEVQEKILAMLEDQGYGVGEVAANALLDAVRVNWTVRRVVLAKLSDPAWNVRQAAVNALNGMVETDEEIRLAVLAKLDDSDEDVRKAAIGTLSGTVGSDRETCHAVLAKLSDPFTGAVALSALSKAIGSDEDVRRAVLAKLYDPYMGSAAINALAGIAGSDEEVRRALCEKIESGSEHEQIAAVRALSSLVSSHAEVGAAFRTRLSTKAWNVRRSLAEVLGENSGTAASLVEMAQLQKNRATLESLKIWEDFASGAPTCLTANEKWMRFWLEKILSGTVEERRNAIGALKNRLREDSNLRRTILMRLEDRDPSVGRSALNALAVVVGTDAEVREATLRSLRDKDYQVRRIALGALSGIVGSDNEVRQAVLERLGDKEYQVRESALKALSGVVGMDANVRQAVLERLENEEIFMVRQSAVSALSGVIGTDPEVRQIVLEMLGDKNYQTRQSALNALAEVVGADSEVRLAVLERLEDESSAVRQSALSALSGVVSTDTEVRQVVLKRLEDKEVGIRAAAIRALKNLFGKLPEVSQLITERLTDQPTLFMVPPAMAT